MFEANTTVLCSGNYRGNYCLTILELLQLPCVYEMVLCLLHVLHDHVSLSSLSSILSFFSTAVIASTAIIVVFLQ
jgi:hypothetical protein